MVRAIDHCRLALQVNRKMSAAGFQEAVMRRAGELIKAAHNGKHPGRSHKLAGVELAAVAVANHVIEEGASLIAKDVGVDLDRLKQQAASRHISSC